MRAYDWAKTPLGPPARLAGCAQDLGAHHAHVAPADLDRLGARAHLPLQRSLQVDHRRQASLGAGQADLAGLARDLVRHRADARHRHARRRRHLRRGAAPDHGAQRLSRGDLLHLLLQPDPDRRRHGGRHHLRQHRRHAARDRRTPARAAARARRRAQAKRVPGSKRASCRSRRSPPTGATSPSPRSTWSSRPTRAVLVSSTGLRARTGCLADVAVRSTMQRRGRSPRCCATTSPSGSRICRASSATTRRPARGRSRRRSAVLLPIASSGETGRAGVLVVGLNPFRLYDDNYRGLPRSRRTPGRGGDRQCRGLRAGAAARRGAGRDRPRQDRVLLQRQPRVPHAAHPDAGPARRGAGQVRRRRHPGQPRAWCRRRTATACGC